MSSSRDAVRQAELWDQWSEEFPHLYPDRDPTDTVAFVHRLVPSSAEADAGSALELGAGTGRVAVPLARAGIPVVALDVSPAMVRRLRANSSGLPVTAVEADMAEYCTGRHAVVYAVHSSFFHITDQQRQVSCMVNVARMLAPGGTFVLSCFVPGVELLGRREALTLRGFTEESVDIRATTVDLSTQMVVYRELSVRADGIRILPVEQRFCWPSELDLMARLAGLALAGRFADYSGRPYRHGDHSHVSVYRRAEDDVET